MPRRAKYWRALAVEGVEYVWKAAIGRDRGHSGVRVAIRVAADAPPAGHRARRTDAGRGATLLVHTAIGGPDACNGPQCPKLSPPKPIGPMQVAEMVRQGLTLGWPAAATTENTRFDCHLVTAMFTKEGIVRLTLDRGAAAEGG